MPPRTLASLAQAFGAAADMEGAFAALNEALVELDRGAQLALLTFDARRQLLRDRLTIGARGIDREQIDTTFDHLPREVRTMLLRSGAFADVGDSADEYARLFGIAEAPDGGLLSLRGFLVDGQLSSVLALYEPRRFFGARVVERFAPYATLFELAHARFAEREARHEAVRTLEEVTKRVHADYLRDLETLQGELAEAREAAANVFGVAPDRVLQMEKELSRAQELARKMQRRAEAVEGQVGAAVSKLEQAHIELHRRSEMLRQKTRTLYLIDRVLTIDATTLEAKPLADGLLALISDDMQSHRCSLMLAVAGSNVLFIAAAKGLSPDVGEGHRIRLGQGVAGRVAQTRTPLLVTDVTQEPTHPLLADEYLTSGSFISFPLVYHDQLIGVVNLTNRAQQGIFVDEDVERVRILALVIALVATHAALPERLLETIGVR